MRIALCLVMVVALGCDSVGFKGGPGEGGVVAAQGGVAPSMFAPVGMRVHPVTKITRDAASGDDVIEAYIEFADQFGDVTKAAGRMRFEAYAERAEATRRDTGVREELWQVAIDDVDSNVRHYDPITRSYAFRLKLPRGMASSGRLRLTAQFSDGAGTRLTAEQVLSRDE